MYYASVATTDCNSAAVGAVPQTEFYTASMRTNIALLPVILVVIPIISGSATFTRWGKTTCPSGNELIYKGFTGGNRGSSSTILCLPDDPIYDEYTPGQQSEAAYIYGTEYQTGAYSGSHLKNLHNHDIPCAVCESETKKSVIMVPARNLCFPGWNLEYRGYLMGDGIFPSASEFICADNDAESMPGSQAYMNSKFLYLVESKCGALPCQPYNNDGELTCAVCTKEQTSSSNLPKVNSIKTW